MILGSLSFYRKSGVSFPTMRPVPAGVKNRPEEKTFADREAGKFVRKEVVGFRTGFPASRSGWVFSSKTTFLCFQCRIPAATRTGGTQEMKV
jgi:hypothetical protein